MENDIHLCFFFLFCAGVSSQNVTITEDTVYIMNNILGQVTCNLNGTYGAIVWYLSSIPAPVVTAFVGGTCSNTTNGYYQTCDDQSHQYTLYFTGTTNLHGQTIRCSGEGCTPHQTILDTVRISIIDGPSNVSYQPGITSYTRNEGENLGPIQCVSDCNPICNFVWTRPGQSDYNGKNLTISAIRRTQEGDFKCTARNSHGSLSGSKISVVVDYGPDPVTLTPSTNNYIVNETFRLGPIKCSATCKPTCSYKWIRPNQNAIQGDTLKISSIQRTQTGTYKCQAYNAVGTRNSNDVSVTIFYAAKVKNMVISDGNNFMIPEHSTQTITCLAEGFPQPTMALTYISNSSIIKSISGFRLDFTFPLAKCEDTGIYRCDAINKFTPQQPLQKQVFVLSNPNLNSGVVVGAVVGSAVAFIIVAVAIALFRRFKATNSNGKKETEDIQMEDSNQKKYNNLTACNETNIYNVIGPEAAYDNSGDIDKNTLNSETLNEPNRTYEQIQMEK